MRGILVVFLLISGVVCSQNKQLLYDYRELPQSLALNPGSDVSSYDFHVGFPLLSHIYVHAGVSGVNAFELFADDGVNFNTKLRNVLFSMSENDIYTANQQLEIFSGGFRPGDFNDRRYFSFGMYQEIDIHVYHPKDPAELALEGNGGPNINRVYDFGHVNASGELLTVFHFGFNKQVDDKLTYGFRGKVYSSIFDMRSTSNDALFFTEPGENNFYRHNLISDITVNTSGYASLRDIDSEDTADGSRQVLTKFRNRALLGGNIGLGFDVGFTYHYTDQLSVTASLLDVGFIRHNKDVENYSIRDAEALEGIELLFPGIDDVEDEDDFWQDLIEDLDQRFSPDTTNTAYTSWRPTKMNASVRYDFGKRRATECNCSPEEEGYLNAIGAHLYAIRRPRLPQFALTAYYYRRVSDFLRVKATYTVDRFTPYNLGLGMSMHFGNFNFYLMGDNLWSYRDLAKAHAVSVQLGFNYVFPHTDNPFK